MGHKLSMKYNSSYITVKDSPLRNEREDTNGIGISLGKVSICPNQKTLGTMLIQEIPDSPLLGNQLVLPLLCNGLVQEIPDSPSIEEEGHELSMESNSIDMVVS